jgi:hypothetical protein
LWQKAVVLKDKADSFVSEAGQLSLSQLKWILTIEAYGTAGWRLKRANDVKQRALTASRWAHDRDRVAASKRKRNVGDNS